VIDMNAPALVRPVAARNQPPSPAREAIVVDVRDDTIGLRLDMDADLAPNRIIEVAVDGCWSRGRVLWSRAGVRNALIASVQVSRDGC
jgi:hypothetical protein